jgi:hypothetical protein
MSVNVRWARAPLSLVLCCAPLALLQPACDSCRGKDSATGEAAPVASVAEVPRLPIALRLSEAERKTAGALVGKIRRGRFPKRVLEDKANGNLFLYLAASSDQPRVIEASLDGMRVAFAGAKGKRTGARVSEDYGVVVAAHLQSDKPLIQIAAVNAASPALSGDKPSRPVVDELAAIVESCPDAYTRVQALVALGSLTDFAKHESAVGALLRVLDSDMPAAISRALRNAIDAGPLTLPKQAEFSAKARALMSHKDATVRGRAAHLALALNPTDPALWEQVAAMLADPQGCVRTEVAAGLAGAGNTRAIHRLVPLAADFADARCETPYRLPNGKTEGHAVGKRGSAVADYAIPLIVTLSQAAGVPFQPPPEDKAAKDRTAQRKATAGAVQTWYAANKAKLPKDEAPPPAKPGDKTADEPADAGAPKPKAPAATVPAKK